VRIRILFLLFIRSVLFVSLNRQEGAKGADEWLPPNYSYRCAYIARVNSVMDKYELKLKYIPAEQ
jgi:hypothetical protein